MCPTKQQKIWCHFVSFRIVSCHHAIWYIRTIPSKMTQNDTNLYLDSGWYWEGRTRSFFSSSSYLDLVDDISNNIWSTLYLIVCLPFLQYHFKSIALCGCCGQCISRLSLASVNRWPVFLSTKIICFNLFLPPTSCYDIMLPARPSFSSPNEVPSCCAKTDGGSAASAAGIIIMAQTRVAITRITGEMFESIDGANKYYFIRNMGF